MFCAYACNWLQYWRAQSSHNASNVSIWALCKFSIFWRMFYICIFGFVVYCWNYFVFILRNVKYWYIYLYFEYILVLFITLLILFWRICCILVYLILDYIVENILYICIFSAGLGYTICYILSFWLYFGAYVMLYICIFRFRLYFEEYVVYWYLVWDCILENVLYMDIYFWIVF